MKSKNFIVDNLNPLCYYVIIQMRESMFYSYMRELTKIHLEETPDVQCRMYIGILPYIRLSLLIAEERRETML